MINRWNDKLRTFVLSRAGQQIVNWRWNNTPLPKGYRGTGNPFGVGRLKHYDKFIFFRYFYWVFDDLLTGNGLAGVTLIIELALHACAQFKIDNVEQERTTSQKL